VLVVDPEDRALPAADVLRLSFGLTRTQAVIAQLVLNGEGLGPIAAQLSISQTTVRTRGRDSSSLDA
jgi:DNA-binding CsgD family transcriptional regulator